MQWLRTTTNRKLASVIVLLALASFLVDSVIPLGVVIYLPYVAVVILASWLSHRRYIYWAATASTVLTILGLFVSPPGGVWWQVVTNRSLALGTLWVVAILALQRWGLIGAMQQEQELLEKRVEERTKELVTTNAHLQQEVMERKRAEAAAQQQRDWLNVTLCSIGDAVLATDTDRRITFINPVAESLTGWHADEVIGRDCEEVFRIIHEHTRQPLESPVPVVLRHGETVSLANHSVLLSRHGHEVSIADSAAPIRAPSGLLQGVVLVFRDVTEQQRLEAELRHAQKMQAVGTLAGGMAHEFNNLLMAILGFAELTLYEVDEQSTAGRHVQHILQAGRRAKELVDQVLAFSHPVDAEHTPVQVSLLVSNALDFLQVSLPSSIVLQLHDQGDTGTVLANAAQIHQVVLNLCANAVDAMRATGGQLTVQVEVVHVDQSFAATNPALAQGSYVRLLVGDTGEGIAPQLLPRLFEPFFTTKGIGEGTGMGLAIVHGIVTSHNGVITVESQPGVGTMFAVYFPQVAEVISQAAVPQESVPHGVGRILFVDDETAVRHLAQEWLTQLGYETVAHANSREALETFQASPQHFDLVITDQTMPGMTGITLTQEIRRLRPDIPIILCTGFRQVMDTDPGQALGVTALLMKPFTLKDLGVTIHRILA